MLIDFLLNRACRVAHKDPTVRVTRAHLRLRALQSWEEFSMDQRGFLVLELLCNIPCKSEVGILVDSTWNQAGFVGRSAKNMRERVREAWSTLDSCEVDFPDVVPA